MSDTTNTSTKQGSVEMDDVLRYELLESNGPKGAPTGDPVLSVRDLKVSFNTEAGRVDAVRGVNFDLWGGRTLGIVGESGSGKSVTALALIGLLDDNAHVTGSIKLGDEELIGKTDEEMSQLRGTKISMIFQDPLSALTPMFSIGDQLAEALLTHNPHMSKADVRKRCIELLSIVGITDPENRLDSFPHEFSGGMRQRVVIAIAIANNPDIIIADEPTTALDVTIQAQILDVLKVAQKETGAAVVLITHDLGVVALWAFWVLFQNLTFRQSIGLFLLRAIHHHLLLFQQAVLLIHVVLWLLRSAPRKSQCCFLQMLLRATWHLATTFRRFARRTSPMLRFIQTLSQSFQNGLMSLVTSVLLYLRLKTLPRHSLFRVRALLGAAKAL